MKCGLHYPLKNEVVLEIGYNLVVFDLKNMKMTRNADTKSIVFHIEKVDDETFLTGGYNWVLELFKKKNLTCLDHLKIEGAGYIS